MTCFEVVVFFLLFSLQGLVGLSFHLANWRIWMAITQYETSWTKLKNGDVQGIAVVVVSGYVYSYYSVIVIENRPIGPKSPVKHRNA